MIKEEKKEEKEKKDKRLTFSLLFADSYVGFQLNLHIPHRNQTPEEQAKG